MVEKQNDKNTLINKAIDASMEFEELMDKTDFDSWFENEDPTNFADIQDVAPFEKFKDNIDDLKDYCNGMITNETGDKSSLEQPIVDELFNAKIKRIEARICLEKEYREKNYKKALYLLLSALNQLQKPKGDNIDKRLLILLYNDLSICYAGLENSSMSRGYAQEARWIIEKKEESYKEHYKDFYQELDADEHDNKLNISNFDFVSLRLDELYNIAVYNQAVAERGSHYYSDAEKNFRRIIDDAEKRKNIDTSYRNFNYCSALLNLSDLYIDLSRGKEAIELLDKALEKKSKLDENDIRYWNVILTTINALIDQTEYKKAKYLLRDKHIIDEHIIVKEITFTLKKRHRITSTGFKGLNCFVRCTIENARDELKMNYNETKDKLNKAKTFIEDNMDMMEERKQEVLKIKAYKQLSDIYKILSQIKKDQNEDHIKDDEKVIEHLIRFISEDNNIDTLKAFIDDSEKMGEWVDECDDLDALESLTIQIITKVQQDERIIQDEDELRKYKDLLKKLREKITKECEDKDQLHRAERIGKQIEEILGEEIDKKYMGNFFREKMENIFPDESSNGKENLTRKKICERLDLNEKEFDSIFPEGGSRDKDNLTRKDIYERLDINEMEFDSSFFVRSEIKEKHIVEVIVLRRWNSFSPGLYKESTGSLGGGYLLRINKGLLMKEDEQAENGKNEQVENIVIDPGYNFIQSFRNEDFYVEDIDTIIVTHSHLDHCAELLQIMDLLHQFNKRYKDTTNEIRHRKRVNLCLSKGAYTKFSSFTNEGWQEQLKDVIILENLDKGMYKPFSGLKISAFPTHHMDLGGVNAIGLKIEIDTEKEKLCLGFTGDTPWSQEIREKFNECDLLCVHLGSIKYQEIGYTEDRYNLKSESREIKPGNQEKEFKKKFIKANHLLFHGTLDFIEHCSVKDEPLIIVGEFGEELKYGLRTDLCRKLWEEANKEREEKKKIVCLPGDIGLYIGIEEDRKKKVRCNFCEKFVKQKEIETFSYGREDALHYICKTCGNTLTDLQKQTVIEHRVTRH